MYRRATSVASILLLQRFSHFPVIPRGQLKKRITYLIYLIPMLLALLCSVQETWAQNTWYSKSGPDNLFSNTANWSANPDGSGGSPPLSAFTDGTDNFVVQNNDTRTINTAITINSLTVNDGGEVNASGGSLTLNGNLINNGTFSINVLLTFSGSNNASIGGTEAIEVTNITVNKSSGATLTAGSNNIIISNNVFTVSSGNFVAGSGEIEFVSGAGLTISNGTAGTVDFTTNQGTLAFASGGISTITADKDVTFFNIRNQKSGETGFYRNRRHKKF